MGWPTCRSDRPPTAWCGRRRARSRCPVLDEAQQAVVDHRGRPAARAGRPGHRQDHHGRRGGGGPHRRGARPRAGARPDLRPPGRRRAARRGSPPAWAAPPRSRWRGPSTPTRSACCAARRRCGASRRRGCCPARSRTWSSATCSRATSRPARPAGRSGCTPALPTRGFAQELRDLVMRAYERGVTADGARAARPAGGPRRLARGGALHAAVRRGDRAAGRRGLRPRRADPGRRRAAGCASPSCSTPSGPPGRSSSSTSCRTPTRPRSSCCGCSPGTVATWWRSATRTSRSTASAGADVDGIRDFPSRFPTAVGRPAPVLRARDLPAVRPGPAGARPAGSPPASAAAVEHRRLRGGRGACRTGRCRSPSCGRRRRRRPRSRPTCARPTCSTACRGPGWRCWCARPPARCRCCAARMLAAGVPVAVARRRGAAHAGAGRPAAAVAAGLRGRRRTRLDEDAAVELVTSALGGADVMALRRLRQALRRAELDAGGGRASGPLLVEALDDPSRAGDPGHQCGAAGASGSPTLLAVARAAAAEPGATAETVLWAGVVAHRARRAVGASQPRGRRRRRGGRPRPGRGRRPLRRRGAVLRPAAGGGAGGLPRPPAGPADPGRGPGPAGAVHRRGAGADRPCEQGLEWDVVCVPAVQEGSWPDLRMRGSFLGSERLVDLLRERESRVPTVVATAATLGRLLEEERRLFYVAVTRARRAAGDRGDQRARGAGAVALPRRARPAAARGGGARR